ncbi:MAG: alpha/beta hydrolase, partial [Mesorhizobium sp.]
TAPPSVLPDISPSKGEIGSFRADASPATREIGESRRGI